MLKPMDIHNKEFRKAVRGYDSEEVDEFLDEIIVDFEKLQREVDLLRNQLNSYSDNMASYKEKENALNNAIISAQQFADNIRKDAEIQAHALIKEAEVKAQEILGSSEGRLNDIEEKYNQLNNKYYETKDNLKKYLYQQIELLDKENYFDEPVFFEPVASVETMPAVSSEDEDSSDVEETKINIKLKELMDAKNYNEQKQRSTGSDYRY